MNRCGPRGYIEPLGQFGIREAFGDQLGDLPLAWRQYRDSSAATES
jgi:hypothetical protein